VHGRLPYAEGTLDAVEYLVKRMGAWEKEENRDKRVFTMIDVLQGGAM
jgi:hypothetical protein